MPPVSAVARCLHLTTFPMLPIWAQLTSSCSQIKIFVPLTTFLPTAVSQCAAQGWTRCSLPTVLLSILLRRRQVSCQPFGVVSTQAIGMAAEIIHIHSDPAVRMRSSMSSTTESGSRRSWDGHTCQAALEHDDLSLPSLHGEDPPGIIPSRCHPLQCPVCIYAPLHFSSRASRPFLSQQSRVLARFPLLCSAQLLTCSVALSIYAVLFSLDLAFKALFIGEDIVMPSQLVTVPCQMRSILSQITLRSVV